jgi:hypothetical protein
LALHSQQQQQHMANAMKLNWKKKEEGADDFGKNERRGSFFFARLDGVFFFSSSLYTHTHTPS